MSVSPFWLQHIFFGHEMSRMTTDFPKDAEIINGTWDADRNRFVLTVTSATFDDVPDGHTMPEWSPTVTLHTSESAGLLNLVQRELKERA